tara:strand:- start:31 stop:456 length:426 start_codon:yes stop_codon:yes gene_type:complete
LEINFIDFANDFITEYKIYIVWLVSISLGIFVFSLVTIKWLVALIPEDYFVMKSGSKFRSKRPYLWLITAVVKNLVGYTLILGGIIMLFVPGQGLFTIFIGLILSNYPGKYYVERRIVAMPKILNTVNWLRKKTDKPPLKI